MEGFIKLPREWLPKYDTIKDMVKHRLEPEEMKLWYTIPSSKGKIFMLLTFLAEFKKTGVLKPGETIISLNAIGYWIAYWNSNSCKWEKESHQNISNWIKWLVKSNYIYQNKRFTKDNNKLPSLFGIKGFDKNYSGTYTKEVRTKDTFATVLQDFCNPETLDVEQVDYDPLLHIPKKSPKNSPLKEKKRVKKGFTDPPEIKDFPLSEKLKTFAFGKGLTEIKIIGFAEECFNYHKSKGLRKKDWDATIMNWAIKDQKWNEQRNNKPMSDIDRELERLKMEENIIEGKVL